MRSSRVNAARQTVRAWSPQAWMAAPPVELGTVRVTRPSSELE
jgi:hypothetical protein